MKPYYQHSLKDDVLWSLKEIRAVKNIRVVPFPDDEKDKQEQKRSFLRPVQQKPPPPPRKDLEQIRSKRSVFKGKKRSRRSSMQTMVKSIESNQKNGGGKNGKTKRRSFERANSTSSVFHLSGGKKPNNNVWYRIVEEEKDPYYQNSVTSEVKWSLEEENEKGGEVIVVPFPE